MIINTVIGSIALALTIVLLIKASLTKNVLISYITITAKRLVPNEPTGSNAYTILFFESKFGGTSAILVDSVWIIVVLFFVIKNVR